MNTQITAQIAGAYYGSKVKTNDTVGKLVGVFSNHVCCNIELPDGSISVGHLLSDCQLILTPLSLISDEHAIEVAKIINPELSGSEYRISAIGRNNDEEVHGDILNIEFEWFCKHPNIMNWIKSVRIQIDTTDFDVVYQSWHADEFKYKDGFADNIAAVIDKLRELGYDCGYGPIKSLIEAGIAVSSNDVK